MTVLPFVPRQSREDAGVAVRTFESATAEVIARQDPVVDRSTLYVFGAFVLGVIAFICVFQIDRIVKAPGRIVATVGAITVQPFGEGIIKTIEVDVGQVVKKDQVLATLDPTFVQANLEALKLQISSLKPLARRLEAQEAGTPYIAADNGPYEVLQANLWQSEAATFKANVDMIDQQIAAAEAQIAGLKRDIVNYTSRVKIAEDIEGMRTAMEKQGYESRLIMLGASDTRLLLTRELTDSQNEINVNEHTIESLRAKRDAYIQNWHDTNLSGLISARNQLDAAQQSLAKAEKLSELSTLVSPADAVVASIPKLTGGAVAQSAQPLFSLVPLDAPLEADVQIDATTSGYVAVGDTVTIKFDTFPYLEHGTAEGVVRTVTQDSFVTQDGQDAPGAAENVRSPYFNARVSITGLNLHDVPPSFRLTPGLTVQTDIIVGSRTIMWYLLSGALRSGAEAMHEP